MLQSGRTGFHIFKETNLQLTLTKIPVIRKLVNTVIMVYKRMKELEQRITENGIDYVFIGDYYYPDLKLPKDGKATLWQIWQYEAGLYKRI